MRFFNTAGPVRCDQHYCVPPLHRFDLDEVMMLIQQGKYFLLHAPRQVGKTSYLLALRDYLNQTGRYNCLYINVEAAQAAREKVTEAIGAIIEEFISRAEGVSRRGPLMAYWLEVRPQASGYSALNTLLSYWARTSALPTVLLIDEIDSLVGDTLISVLRQLRAGYDKRPARFPQGIVLCGVRDLRDYRIHASSEKDSITGGSAFNIKAVSWRMGDFIQEEASALLQQHTAETGQVFEPAALEMVWELSQGQPWLTNALAYEVCFRMKAGRDRAQPITAEQVANAKEALILRRETHLDQLADKLKEPRVRRVVEPLLSGTPQPRKLPQDDVEYVADLGLITTRGQLRIANPIYQEVIPRTLIYTTQLTISHQPAWYTTPNGQLDMFKLLTAFQEFFREHSEHWVERFDYKEAGPQLLMQAFLQRIVNAGGRVEREYGLGRGRTDLLVIWQHGERVQKTAIELKILHKSLKKTISEGLKQTWDYMDRAGTPAGHLIIFDRTPDKPWGEKIFVRKETYQGQEITVWGM